VTKPASPQHEQQSVSSRTLDVSTIGRAGVTKPSVADVFRDHAARVIRFLRYLGVPKEALNDASQEAFLVVHRRLGEFEGRASIETWLYEICVRVAHAERRRRLSSREIPTATLPEAETPAHAEPHAMRDLLLRALNSLPAPQREIFVLVEIEELSMKQAVEIVGCPMFTGYSRYRLARTALRRAIDRLTEEDS
jgi:RNA polymerase sigma-70 factor (ECF subfamily)